MRLIIITIFAFNAYGFLPKAFRANYEEVHKSIVTGKEKSSLGTLEYKYPGKIRLVSKREGTIFVSSGKVSWYYTSPVIDGEPGYCTIKRSGDMGFIRLFDSLQKGLVNNKLYKVKRVRKRREIIFTEKGREKLGLKLAQLFFKGGPEFSNLKEILINYEDNRSVKLRFKKVVSNPKYDKDFFVFSIPKNTKLNYQ